MAVAHDILSGLLNDYKANPERWVQGWSFKNNEENGEIIGYCLSGGIALKLYELYSKEPLPPVSIHRYDEIFEFQHKHIKEREEALGLLIKAIINKEYDFPHSGIVIHFNDTEGRKVEEVIEVLERAVALEP
jgi:hypothetical protein